MAGLDPILKYIHDLDSPYKLAGFVVIAFFAGVATLAKRKNIVTKAGFIVMISILGLITCVAIFASVSVKRTYTLYVSLLNEFSVHYTYGQADVKVNIKMASKDYSSTSDSWTFMFEPDELPPNRGVNFSANTPDNRFIVDTLINLSDATVQEIALTLKKNPGIHDSVPPPTTFWLNLNDKTIRQDITDNTGYVYNPASARNRISVSYDPGKIEKQYSGCYTFNRSSPVVTIDGVRFSLENCYIPDYPGPNTLKRQNIENYASEQSSIVATAFFRHNPKLLATWLKSSGH